MKYYLKDIFPRLSKYSATLDQTAFLVDKPWVVNSSDDQPFQKLIFRRDGRVHLSSDGNLMDGKWEYLPEAQALIIDYGTNKKLYRHEFLDEAVLALKIDGRKTDSDKDFFVLGNEKFISDGDSIRYLKNKYYSKYSAIPGRIEKGNKPYTEPIKTEYGSPGHKLPPKKPALEDGFHTLEGGTKKILVRNGKQVKTLHKRTYDGNISIWQDYNIPQAGNVVLNVDSGTFKIQIKGEHYKISVNNGKIRYVYNVSLKNSILVSITFILILWALSVLIIN